ncbi:unnamed protein product [Coregonus sp. 'balchen']|nr:unnamed protein product [Coregonus sp. 'balchen']
MTVTVVAGILESSLWVSIEHSQSTSLYCNMHKLYDSCFGIPRFEILRYYSQEFQLFALLFCDICHS